MLEIFGLAGMKQESFDVRHFFPGIDAIEEAHREFLIGTPRYERFMQGETIEEWVGMLGTDVLSLTHPHDTRIIARTFSECSSRAGLEIPGSERVVLEVASDIHDFGEIKDEVGGVGDISHDKKLESDRTQEEVVFARLVDRHVYDPHEAQFLRQIYQNIVHGDKSQGLARQFNAIERIGYLLTAHQAFVGVNGQRIGNWRGLVGNVLSNQTGKLIGYADEYPTVQNVLTLLKSDITAMLDETVNSEPVIDNENTLSFDVKRLQQAVSDWNQFLAA